jgi:hypothetical protein
MGRVMPSGDRRSRPLELASFAFAALGVLAGIGWLAVGLGSNVLSDVHAYYDAAARLNAGVPLYAQDATTNEAAFYRYPPLLAIAFRPLAAALPFESAALVWEAVVVVSLVGLVVVLRPGRLGWLAAAILALPIIWSVDIGQAQVPVTFLLALGTPWSIALAANLKIFPALAAVWWIGRRDWASLGRFTAWIAGLAVLQLVLEPAGSLAFPSVFNLGTVGEVRNWSPYAISPILWAVLLVAGTIVAIWAAPRRWGWAAAVALSVLATPRLILYQLMTLLAGARVPEPATREAEPAAGALAATTRRPAP